MATRKSKSSLKIGKRTYKKVSCSSTKTAATSKAKSMRKNGKTATIRKQDGKYCIFSAGKRRKARKRA